MSQDPRIVKVASGPIDARIRPPGSKSETIRTLTAASLADGRSHLYTALHADDTAAMTSALTALGIDIDDGIEPWTVDGCAGRLQQPSKAIQVGESGLSARISVALAASVDGTTVIDGGGRLPDRPMSGLIESLRSMDVEIEGERLPLRVSGRGHLWGGTITVDCTASSQFATALMLVAPLMHEPCLLEVTGLAGSSGYLDMTAATMRQFGATVEPTFTGYEIANDGYRAADVVIEPDMSAAVYPMAAAAVTRGQVMIEGVRPDTLQPDALMVAMLETMGCGISWEPDGLTVDATGAHLKAIEADMADAPDGALALAIVCLFADGPSRLRGLGSLRHKESDRLAALSAGIRRLGGDASVDNDTLVIIPARLHGNSIDPHGDHRIAMSLAIVGLVTPGVGIESPGVVDKTWPGFWSALNLLGG